MKRAIAVTGSGERKFREQPHEILIRIGTVGLAGFNHRKDSHWRENQRLCRRTTNPFCNDEWLNRVLAEVVRDRPRAVSHPRKLLEIEREFSSGDPVLVRTAVFGMLHAGRLSAPDLHTQMLSLLTSFIAAETKT